MRLLIVDDDPALRALFRATFDVVDVEVEEAESGEAALAAIERAAPDAVVLDVHMPGMGGVELCHRIKRDLRLAELPVVLLSGADAEGGRALVEEAGADAFMLKPFSPLELLDLVERLAGGGALRRSVPAEGEEPRDEQLLLYARDLRRLLELERGQRVLLHDAYAETVSALASALESKDTGTRAHSQRVQRYAIELALAVSPDLAEDPGAEYGFLLHDVGKIGIPDRILQKPGPLNEGEARLMRTHTLLGEQMLEGVGFLRGEGLGIVRSHHERWDGSGYPDGRTGTDIPMSARVFAVADTLDAMTSDRPYRPAVAWAQAGAEIVREAGGQFDSDVVRAFREREPELRRVAQSFAAG